MSSTIYKNTAFLAFSEIIAKVLQLILFVYAARLLDQQSFGKFNFALSLSIIAIIIADFGVNYYVIREIARDKKKVNLYFINAFVLKLGTAAVTYLLVVAFLNLLQYPAGTKEVVYAIWIFTILSTFTDLFYSVFRAFEVMIFDAVLKIARMLILTSAGMYVLFKGYGVLIFSLMFIFTEIIILLIACIISYRKIIKPKLEIDLKFIKDLAKKSYPFGLAFIFSTIYFYIDGVMLSKMRGDVEVAVYSAAYNLALAILFIPVAYTNALYPVFSRYFHASKDKIIMLYKQAFKHLYIIGLPISVGLYFMSEKIIRFLYGTKYNSSVIALQIISWFLFIKFVNALQGILLSSIDQQEKRLFGQGSTAIFNIALNLILIPKMGYVGAAISTFITEIFLFVVYYWQVSRSFFFYNFFPILIKPLIAAAIMGIFIYYVHINLFVQIILAGIIYFIIILSFRAIKKEDFVLNV